MSKRSELLNSIMANVQGQQLVQHMLATEAIMRALARRKSEDEDEWGFAGLLHDIDAELVEGDLEAHGKLGADIARELGVSERISHAILCHNEELGFPRQTDLDRALFCADPLSGLITAAALVRPDKLSGLAAKSVMKRFNEKSFAAGVSREQIAECREIGMELAEFITLGLEAMKDIARSLKL
jgi:putative nucleotidyltransferase with HDIG domain